MRLFARKRSDAMENEAAEILPAGTPAPDFRLQNAQGEWMKFGDFRGRPLIIAFYPGDWSPVCGAQMVLYNEVLPLFEEHNAQIVGISVDSRWSHLAYQEANGLNFPLLADFEPKGAVSRMYGAYDSQKGTSKRALFVLDGEGVIQWSYVSPNHVNPGANGILEALEEMTARQPASLS